MNLRRNPRRLSSRRWTNSPSNLRRKHSKKPFAVERLEGRVLLSGEPTVASVARMDDPGADHLRVAVTFSEAMDPSTAGDAANYAIAQGNGPGLRIVSAEYADAGGQHQAIVTATTRDGTPVPGGDYDVRLQGTAITDTSGVPMVASGDEVAVLVNERNAVLTVGGDDQGGYAVRDSASLGYGPPEDVTSADFNGDDIPDLATISQGDDGLPGQVVILDGEGGGRFARASRLRPRSRLRGRRDPDGRLEPRRQDRPDRRRLRRQRSAPLGAAERRAGRVLQCARDPLHRQQQGQVGCLYRRRCPRRCAARGPPLPVRLR